MKRAANEDPLSLMTSISTPPSTSSSSTSEEEAGSPRGSVIALRAQRLKCPVCGQAG